MDEDEVNLAEALEAKGYRFIRQIGEGGTAYVFLVESLRYKTNFVCKQILLETRGICKECEIRALQSLNSSSVIQLYDYYIKPKYLFLFLEFCPKGSLEEYIKKNGPMKDNQLLGMCKSILVGIEYIHSRRCAHSDLKPANILLDRTGKPKLADFGFSKIFPIEKPNTDQRVGSLVFMAPEIFHSSRYNPFPADIWSLGVTFYYLATGTYPWPLTTYQECVGAITTASFKIPDDVDERIKMLIMSMLNPHAERRPRAKELLASPCFKGIVTKNCSITTNQRNRSSSSANLLVNQQQQQPEQIREVAKTRNFEKQNPLVNSMLRSVNHCKGSKCTCKHRPTSISPNHTFPDK